MADTVILDPPDPQDQQDRLGVVGGNSQQTSVSSGAEGLRRNEFAADEPVAGEDPRPALLEGGRCITVQHIDQVR